MAGKQCTRILVSIATLVTLLMLYLVLYERILYSSVIYKMNYTKQNTIVSDTGIVCSNTTFDNWPRSRIRDLLQRLEAIANNGSFDDAALPNKSVRKEANSDQFHRHSERKTSFLTLFTTWNFNPGIFNILNNTMDNWRSFFPNITCIVFTNDSRIESAVVSKYCGVHKIYNAAENGLPILKYMYYYAMERFDSEYYSYVNSDILFTDNLLYTLSKVRKVSNNSSGILITGQRWNLIINKTEIVVRHNLSEVVSKNGSLFAPWAFDYFITNKYFPWDNFDDVVIGMPGVDNWLLMYSRKLGIEVIDGTKTVLAVHLSYDSNMRRSHKRGSISKYNTNLIQKIHGPQNYSQGQINCIRKYTINVNDEIVFRNRKRLPGFCDMK